jgi:hypothetical protein
MKKVWLRQLVRKFSRKQRGIAAVSAAFGMTSFVLAAGLAIDVSHMYLAGSELQNAADASAIAGASKINGFASGITAAADAALATQNRFEFSNEVATFARSNVRFGINSSDLTSGAGYDEAIARGIADRIRFIKVTIPNKSIAVPFAQMALGSSAVQLSRTAVAGFSAGCETLCDSIIPVSAIQDPRSGAPLHPNPGCPNDTQFWPGCSYTVRLGSGGNGNNGSGFITPGNYLILALDGKGGSETREVLAGGSIGCFKPGDVVLTKTGVTTGPVLQGWNTRFDDYGSGLSETEYPPDTNVKENITYAQYRSGMGAFQQAPSHPGKDGRRVVLLPIVNADEYDSGRGTVRIEKFAAFFLQKKITGNGDVQAEFISYKVTPVECYGSTGTENQFSTPVLYK